MLQAILIKTIIGKVMEAIEKADDKKIYSADNLKVGLFK